MVSNHSKTTKLVQVVFSVYLCVCYFCSDKMEELDDESPLGINETYAYDTPATGKAGKSDGSHPDADMESRGSLEAIPPPRPLAATGKAIHYTVLTKKKDAVLFLSFFFSGSIQQSSLIRPDW